MLLLSSKTVLKDDPSNFQPISVISVVAKILEKIVAQQLSTYFESHQLQVVLVPTNAHIGEKS